MDKLQKLQELMKVANEGLTRSEFEASFKVLIDFVSKLKVVNQELVANLERKYQETVSQLSDNKQELETAKKDAMKYCKEEMVKMYKEMGVKMNEMEDKVEEGLQDPHQIALEASKLTLEAVQGQLPTQEQLEQNLPSLGASIRDGLELLPEGEKLKIEAIENLREELDKLKREIMGRVSFGGAGGVIGIRSTKHSLSSQLNGATLTFSLPAFSKIGHISSSSFPYSAFEPDVDYTADASNNTITFPASMLTGPLQAGQTLIIELIN